MRSKMSPQDRAKQFMPFAAVKGHTDALRQKEKRVVPRIELSEDMQEVLNRRLRRLRPNDIVTVVYYRAGEYIERTGMVSRLDFDAKNLWIAKEPIPAEDIRELRGERLGDEP